jgi:hypothetical protein
MGEIDVKISNPLLYNSLSDEDISSLIIKKKRYKKELIEISRERGKLEELINSSIG